jgi:hypothetical protein
MGTRGPFPGAKVQSGHDTDHLTPSSAKEKHWTMDNVLKQDSSKYITPSSEPFRIKKGGYKYFVCILVSCILCSEILEKLKNIPNEFLMAMHFLLCFKGILREHFILTYKTVL